ncbi:hypothetical protein NKG94_44785 [Micromonospora sp. M12]
MAIWKDSERQDLAWDYLTVLLNKKNAQSFASSLGFFPVYQDLVAGDTYANDKVMGRSPPPCRTPSSRRSARSGWRSAGPRP